MPVLARLGAVIQKTLDGIVRPVIELPEEELRVVQVLLGDDEVEEGVALAGERDR